MAETVFNGLRMLAGLPKNNGLAPLADDLVDSPDSTIVVVATLRVKDLNHHVENDTTTAVTKLQQIEALTGARRSAAMELLAKAREERTGERAMISPTGELIVEESPDAEKVKGGDAADVNPEDLVATGTEAATEDAIGKAAAEATAQRAAAAVGEVPWEEPEPPKAVSDLAAQKAKKAAAPKKAAAN